jgi:anthranilate phosphoribosyltransferase
MEAHVVLNNLIQKQNLTSDEASQFLSMMMSGNVPPSQIGALLTALRMKGETTEEIVGFIKSMREHMVPVRIDNAIDVCGTGGDGTNTFNISTVVTFVVAGTGVKVAKHGNRAASSLCGCADVLEALGVFIQLSPKQAKKVIQKTGVVFLFAPLYHPSTKHVALVRKELEIRTIFNVLGPFSNPASVKRQLIGVPNRTIARKLAHVAKELGYEHLLLVTSNDGMDEISTSVPTKVFEIKKNIVREYTVSPQKYGFQNCSVEAISGGTPEQNALIIQSILDGQKGSARDIVVFNSAFALYVAGFAKDISEGIVLAEKSIDSGSAAKVLQSLIKETQGYI